MTGRSERVKKRGELHRAGIIEIGSGPLGIATRYRSDHSRRCRILHSNRMRYFRTSVDHVVGKGCFRVAIVCVMTIDNAVVIVSSKYQSTVFCFWLILFGLLLKLILHRLTLLFLEMSNEDPEVSNNVSCILVYFSSTLP